AGGGVHLEDGDGVAQLGQVARAGDAGGAGADDGDTLVLGDGRPLGEQAILPVVVRGALEPADGDGLAVDLVAAADRLAGAGAGAAEHAGHDVGAPVEDVGLVETAVRDQADVVGDVGAGGAADLARDIGLVPVGAHFLRPVQFVFERVRVDH